MPLSETMQNALNTQLNHEFESAYLYLSMSAYLTTCDLSGAAQWMRLQGQEEVTHAMKLYDFIANRGGRIRLDGVAVPPAAWDSPEATWAAALAHEQQMTDRLNALVELAMKERDHATNNLLAWFIDEQVEEEATLNTIIKRVRLIGDDGSGLVMFDTELGRRPAIIPASGA